MLGWGGVTPRGTRAAPGARHGDAFSVGPAPRGEGGAGGGPEADEEVAVVGAEVVGDAPGGGGEACRCLVGLDDLGV